MLFTMSRVQATPVLAIVLSLGAYGCGATEDEEKVPGELESTWRSACISKLNN
jgi:hypothetical protein